MSLKTSFTMRHRLIEAIAAFSPAFAVGDGCGCELDETYFRESFKGNHTKGSFKMPGSRGATAASCTSGACQRSRSAS